MSNGSQIGAVAGAAVGTAIGFAAGMPALGFSVGWAIGGAIGGAIDPPPEQITDLGAQQLPPFNTSLRGTTIPVIFGTNRVAANIVWQGDAATIRGYGGGDSGGKGGGSGGKGGSSQPKTVEYEYRIDLVYHLGLVSQEFALFRVWNNQNEVNQEPASYATEVVKGPIEADPTRTLSYAEYVFSNGAANPTASWSNFTTAITHDARWPYTVWVGYNSLSLGSSVAIPQLNFEVGPEPGLNLDFDGGLIWSTNQANAGVEGLHGSSIDAYGNVWIGLQESSVRVFDDTGALLNTVGDLTTILPTIWANFTASGGSPTFALGGIHWQLILNGTKFMVCAVGRDPGANDYLHWFIADIASNGTLSWAGACRTYVTAAFTVMPGQFHHCAIGLSGFVKNGESQVLFAAWDFANRLFVAHGPKVDQISTSFKGQQLTGIFSRYNPLNDGLYVFHSYYTADNGSIAFNPTCMPSGFFVNVAGVDYLYSYQGKAFVNGPASATFINDLRTNQPTGRLCRIPLQTSLPTVGTTSTTIDLVGLPEYVSGAFQDENGNYVDYFDDDGTDLSNNAAANYYWPWAYTAPLTTGALAAVFFCPIDQNYNASDPMYVRARAYWIDQTTGQFNFIGKGVGPLFAAASAGGSSGVPYWTSFSLGIEGYTIYLYGTFTRPVAALNDHLVKTRLGTFDPDGSADVTPPEIIYQILVSEVFGIFPGANIIDMTSYNNATAYCYNNGIKISCVYKNDNNAWEYIERLLMVYDGYLTIDASAGQIKFGVMDYNTPPVRTIDNHRLLREDANKPPVTTSKGAIQDTYNLVRVSYVDRSLDYRVNQVEEVDEVDQDINGVRMREFPPDFVMPGWLATRMASRALWNNLYARDRHSFKLGWKDADLEPGDVVTLVDSYTNLAQNVQIARMREVERGVFEVEAAQLFTYVPGVLPSQTNSFLWSFLDTQPSSLYTNASSPSNVRSSSLMSGLRYARMYELPYEFAVDGISRLYVGWVPEGYAAGATLYVSADDASYAPIQQVMPYPITGRILATLPNDASPYHVNVPVVLYPSSGSVTSFDVAGSLTDIGAAGMHSGLSLLWVGSEMIAYEGVNVVSQNYYTFDRVYRGWGGTVRNQINSGAIFWKQGAGLFSQEYTVDRIGQTVYYKVVPFDFGGIEYNIASIEAGSYTILGTYYRPSLSRTPEVNSSRALTRLNVGSAGDISTFWRKGSPRSGYGVGGYGRNPGGYGSSIDDPGSLGWRVEIVGSGGVVVRSTFVTTPAYTYTNSMNFSDNGAWRGNIAVKVTPRNMFGDALASSVTSLELFF